MTCHLRDTLLYVFYFIKKPFFSPVRQKIMKVST